MPRKLWLFLLLCLVVPFPSAKTKAQSNPTDTEWFWAAADNQLIAFTLDGQVNVLLETNTPFYSYIGSRLRSDMAVLWDNTSQALILVGSNSATQIPMNQDFQIRGIAYRHPYFFFASSKLMSETFSYVLNVDNGTFQQLTTHQASSIRILGDGHTIRYFSWSNYCYYCGSITGTLWERDLETGQETALLQVPDVFINVYASPDGEQWWIPSGGWNSDDLAYTHMIDFENVQTFGPVNPQFTQWIANGKAIINDGILLHYDPICASECKLDIYFLDGRDSISTLLPASGQYQQYFALMGILPDGGVLIHAPQVRLGPLYAIYQDGQILLGHAGHCCINRSKDRRWVAFGEMDDPHEYSSFRLWDMQSQMLVYETPLPTALKDSYTLNGMFYFGYIFDSTTAVMGCCYVGFGALYTTVTHQSYPLAASVNNIFALLNDGQYLFTEYGSSTQDGKNHIYHYDSVTQTKTLIMVGYSGIRLEDMIE